MAAIILIWAMFLASAALIVAGIGLLAGAPWALIAAGIMIFAAAVAVRNGVIVDG